MKALYEPSREAAAKIVGAHRGHEGRIGGWIYDENGRPIVQGWTAYADRLERRAWRRQSGRVFVPKVVHDSKGSETLRWAINWAAIR